MAVDAGLETSGRGRFSARTEAALSRSEVVVAQAQAVFREIEARQQEQGEALLRASPYARLQARLATLPVIEQAKGIIIAQSRCSADEAFDLLRQASQQANKPVRELAAVIVARAAEADQPGRRRAG